MEAGRKNAVKLTAIVVNIAGNDGKSELSLWYGKWRRFSTYIIRFVLSALVHSVVDRTSRNPLYDALIVVSNNTKTSHIPLQH